MKFVITETDLKLLIQKIFESMTDGKYFLGYHSSNKKLPEGWYKGNILDAEKYPNEIFNTYLELICNYDQNVKNKNIYAMNRKFIENDYSFTFINDRPERNNKGFQYGKYLYKISLSESISNANNNLSFLSYTPIQSVSSVVFSYCFVISLELTSVL